MLAPISTAHFSSINYPSGPATGGAGSGLATLCFLRWDEMQLFALERKKFRQLFTQHIHESGPESGPKLKLGQLALYLAGDEYPFLDTASYVNQLDELASQVHEIADDSANQRCLIDAVSQVLFEQQGFCGVDVDRSDPEYHYLNRVLDTHTGIPITLSLVYLEVARRVGIQCSGIGLPGHFVVHLDELDLFLDPFRSGQLLSTADCRCLVRETVGSHLPWRDEFLTPCSDQDILFRLLNNLKTLYMQIEDYSRAAEVLQSMVLINPSAHYLKRYLAWCYYNIHDHPTALRHLETYLRECWPCSNQSESKYQIESLWKAIGGLN